MTLRSPDENSPLRLFLSEITPRNLFMLVAAIVGTYCTMQVKMSTYAELQAEQQRQIEILQREQAQKLDKEVYQTDQQRLYTQLNDISQTVHGINQYLLDHPRQEK